MTIPPVTHEPHANCVIFKHDCVNVVVAMSICDEGRCHPPNDIIARYRAAGLEADSFPLHPSLNFWEDQEVLRTMASLKLAQHEGRTKTVEWARAKLVELARR